VAALYKGYSSYEFERKKTFELTDIELVKIDLLNHIFTRRGSRVMMPMFGSSVPDIVFEPLDIFTTDTLEDELRRVIAFDPRVRLLSFDLDSNPDNHTIVVTIRLFYIELEITDDFELNIQFET
jgi:phage baseplate assembly protein W